MRLPYHRHLAGWLAILVLVALPLAFAACGDDDDDSSPPPAADPDPEAEGPSGPPDVSVEVTLDEWAVVPSVAATDAGVVRFIAENEGDEIHELVICRESCADHDELAEVDDVSPYQLKSFSVELAPGTYELACVIEETEPNGEVEKHYDMGMHTAFTVE